MFLWWRNTFGPPAETTIEIDEEDIKTKEKIAELKEIMDTAVSSRPSTVSRGTYNKWAVTEGKRLQGEESRVELKGLDSQRQAQNDEFLQLTSERGVRTRAQRESMAQMVRDHKKAAQVRALHIKEDMKTKAEWLRQQREDHQEKSTELGSTHGREQREKLHLIKTEQFESKKQAVSEYRQGEADRAAYFAKQQNALLQKKQKRAAEIKKETAPAVAIHAKEHFAKQKLAVASDVRASVSAWKTEAADLRALNLEKAKAIRQEAMEVQQNAVNGQAILCEQRKSDADAMRRDIQLISDRKQLIHLTAQTAKRDHHDVSFEAKFVMPPQAELVHKSDVDQLSNTHRIELARLKAEGRDPAKAKVVGKPEWFPFFHASGWFT